MNFILTFLGLAMLARAENDNERAIGTVVAGAGLTDVLRTRKD